MKFLAAFFVDRSLLVNLITVGVCVAGAVVIGLTSRALLPDIKPRMITVTAELPGASALDMERFVSFRLEEALSGLDEVERLTSETTNGQTIITVFAEPGIEDINKLSEEVRSRLSAIRYRLPDDLRPLRIETPRVSNDYMMSINITGIEHDNPSHRESIRVLQERLTRIANLGHRCGEHQRRSASHTRGGNWRNTA